jgi:hypothetical protein
MKISMMWRLKAALCFISIFAGGLLNAGFSNQADNSHDCVNCSEGENEEMARFYYTFNYPASTPGGDTFLTGIRKVKRHPREVYISGFYNSPNGGEVIPFVY